MNSVRFLFDRRGNPKQIRLTGGLSLARSLYNDMKSSRAITSRMIAFFYGTGYDKQGGVGFN